MGVSSTVYFSCIVVWNGENVSGFWLACSNFNPISLLCLYIRLCALNEHEKKVTLFGNAEILQRSRNHDAGSIFRFGETEINYESMDFSNFS